MAEIEIKAPFKLEVNIIEIDNYLPSFKLNLKYEIKGMNFIINNEINFWIENKNWNLFLSQFENGQRIELIDIDGINRIIIQNIDEEYFCFKINNSIKAIEINDIICLYEYKIDKDIFEIIKNKIMDFPKWW